MKLNDIPECERCCGVDIDQLESDLAQAHEMIQKMRDALENLAAERCEGKAPCRVQYAHDLVDKTDQKLKRLRGE